MKFHNGSLSGVFRPLLLTLTVPKPRFGERLNFGTSGIPVIVFRRLMVLLVLRRRVTLILLLISSPKKLFWVRRLCLLTFSLGIIVPIFKLLKPRKVIVRPTVIVSPWRFIGSYWGNFLFTLTRTVFSLFLWESRPR